MGDGSLRGREEEADTFVRLLLLSVYSYISSESLRLFCSRSKTAEAKEDAFVSVDADAEIPDVLKYVIVECLRKRFDGWNLDCNGVDDTV